MKIAILSSNNLDLLKNNLEEKLKGNELEFYSSGFNQYTQEIIDSNSELSQFKPDIIIFNIDLLDINDEYLYNSASKEIKEKKEEYRKIYIEIENLIKKLRNNLPDALILFNNFYYPPVNNNSLFNYNSQYDMSTIINDLNNQLFQFSKEDINLEIVDLNSLLMNYGYQQLFDKRMWYLAKMPFSRKGLDRLADLYMNHINAYIGKRKKCVVVDLDNTLWGGVIGDEGIENIKLSNDGIAKAFYDFQRVLLGLYHRGIILAISSKNTEEIALQAINDHPYMVLKSKHFSVMKINWQNKAQNIREIAQKLNIGLDSIVFLDDSEFERELIREQLPQVVVPNLPKDFVDYPEFLMSLPYFEFSKLTFSDKQRNQMYQQNKQREELKSVTTSIEDYYYSLQMKAIIKELDDFSVPRVTQLTQKTNQFNLTTKRYKTSDIERMKNSDDYLVYYLELEDKFGSTGIVGVAIIELIDKEEAVIDSFILSCRVMGRTVETAFLAYLSKELHQLGIKTLYGDYFPTKKNQPVKDLYQNHNFKRVSDSRWRFELEKYKLEVPDWITID